MNEEIKAEQQSAAPKPNEHVTIKKTWLIGGAVLVAFILVVFVWHPFTQPTIDKPAKPQGKFKRDEPTQPQIMQDDYKSKIQDMLKEGMSVAEISKETGIRKDVIRKIKKEMGQTDTDE